jgi:hypothetical protein
MIAGCSNQLIVLIVSNDESNHVSGADADMCKSQRSIGRLHSVQLLQLQCGGEIRGYQRMSMRPVCTGLSQQRY